MDGLPLAGQVRQTILRADRAQRQNRKEFPVSDEATYREFIEWLEKGWHLPETEELLPLVKARYSPEQAAFLTGMPFGLTKLEDFDGTYSGVDVGVAVGGGTAGIAMRNENGVFIRLRAGQQGVKLSLASKGTKLELE